MASVYFPENIDNQNIYLYLSLSVPTSVFISKFEQSLGMLHAHVSIFLLPHHSEPDGAGSQGCSSLPGQVRAGGILGDLVDWSPDLVVFRRLPLGMVIITISNLANELIV